METPKFLKTNKPQFHKKVVRSLDMVFALVRITFNAQNGRWKELCQINCDDIANIHLLFSLPQRSSSNVKRN